jgi:type IX secretion system PorP/SprF family membrane protein
VIFKNSIMQSKNTLIIFIFSSVFSHFFAQQDKLITNFMFDKMSINPGKTGVDMYNSICATSIYRNQWDKVNGAPNSAVLNIEGNLERFFKGGIGLAFYHDAIGFSRQNNLLLNYSYPIRISNVGVLGLGFGIGIINYGIEPNWVPPTTATDLSLPVGFAATNLDANFGAYFQGKDFYVGLSSTHLSESLLKKTVADIDQNYQTARHYYFMGGKSFDDVLNGKIDAQVLLRTDLVKYSFDINTRYFFTINDNELYGGLTYRNSDAIGVLLGFSPTQKFTIGYSYDITINKLASVSRGTHEIVLKYCYAIETPRLTISRNPRFL